jgi:hypothetical protein
MADMSLGVVCRIKSNLSEPKINKLSEKPDRRKPKSFFGMKLNSVKRNYLGCNWHIDMSRSSKNESAASPTIKAAV